MEQNPSPQPIQNTYDDEITLKELILKLRDFWGELWHNKIWIIVVAIVLAAFMLGRTFFTPVVYKANLTFMINEDEGNSLGGAGALLSQFGFGGGSSSEYNLAKVLKLSTSDPIIFKTILDTAVVGNVKDRVGNHIIKIYKLREEVWDQGEMDMSEYKLGSKVDPLKNIKDARALKTIKNIIVGSPESKVEPLAKTKIDEETGIMTVSVGSLDPDLSIDLSQLIYNNLGDFYVSKSIEKAESSYLLVKNKTDSLASELSWRERRLAQFTDRNRNLQNAESRLESDRLRNEISVMRIMHAEAIKNLEIADYSLKQSKPFVQAIDVPFAPLNPETPSKPKAIVIGGFIGAFLGGLFFLSRKIFREAMQD